MNWKAIGSGLVFTLFGGARGGLFGRNKDIHLQDDHDLEYLSPEMTNWFFFNKVSYWIDMRGPNSPPVWKETKYFWRPVRVFHNNKEM
jgi:hypothetical protein